ncbi:MAG: Hsp70 family protein [Acidimicrobiales bacterium]
MARVLKYAIGEVEKREGEPPSRVAVCHPANWGEYKIDLLKQAVRIAGLDPRDTVLLTEPEAAAIYYASQQRVDKGQIVAVYDLGGGTFDTAILRRTDDGFEILGRPEGIERLGGIDFDAAVFAHVARSIGSALDDLDSDDPIAVTAVARLRQDCVEAKEALSADTDATIPVMLPNFQTEVRITRSEFEALIRPALADSIDAMKRAMESAGVAADDVSRVLLVGGSSRIPLISQMVSSGLGRPVSVDAHPKHAIAMGASYAASDEMALPRPTPAGVAPVAAVPPVEAVPTPVPAPVVEAEPIIEPPSVEPPRVEAPSVEPPSVEPPQPRPVPREEWAAPTAPQPVSTPPSAAPPETTRAAGDGGGSKLPMLIGAGAAVLVLGIGGFFGLKALGGDNGGGVDSASTTVVTEPPNSTSSTTEATTTTTESSVSLASVSALLTDLDPFQNEVTPTVDGNEVTLTGTVANNEAKAALMAAVAGLETSPTIQDNVEVLPADEECSDLIKEQPHWVCLASATISADNVITIDYISEFGNDPFAINGGYHLHVFGGDIDPATAGAAGDASVGGSRWLVWTRPTRSPLTRPISTPVILPRRYAPESPRQTTRSSHSTRASASRSFRSSGPRLIGATPRSRLEWPDQGYRWRSNGFDTVDDTTPGGSGTPSLGRGFPGGS